MRKDKVVSEVLGEELAITPSDLYNTELKNAIMGGYDKQEMPSSSAWPMLSSRSSTRCAR